MNPICKLWGHKFWRQGRGMNAFGREYVTFCQRCGKRAER